MRFTTAYYLMLIYITVVVKPLIPFIYDGWSHQFNEIEHISSVHAKYGSNHLQKELAGADHDRGKNQNALRSEDQVPFHILMKECKYEPIANKNTKGYFFYKVHRLPFICIVNQERPPEFS